MESTKLDIRVIAGKKYQVFEIDEVKDVENIEKDIARLEAEILLKRAVIEEIQRERA